MGRMKELWLEQQQEWVEQHPDAPNDDDEYEYWEFLKSFVPDEPFARYRNSIERLDEIAKDSGHLASYPMFHRMMLVQHVAMLEAYLSDRLITIVTALPEARRNLILNHESLRNQKYTLGAMVGHPDLVTRMSTTYLKNLMYHELEHIAGVYKAALGFDMLTEVTVANTLKEAMIDRHHCVHRDGKDNDGKVLTQIDAAYISRMRDNSVALVNFIEANCDHWTKQFPPSSF